MTTNDKEGLSRQLAITIAATATELERTALEKWANDLLRIRDCDIDTLEKAKQAIELTLDAEVVWPAVTILGSEIKRVGWDERSLPARLGLSGVALAATVFSGKAAGIAALGTAVGVPLWVVFGAGGTFIGVLIDEISKAAQSDVAEPPVEKEVFGEVVKDEPSPQSLVRPGASITVARE
jgi:hypothetical protein